MARQALPMAIRIGELLHEQKEALPHGQFTPWIEAHLPFSPRTARNYMRVFEHRERLKTESVSVLTDAYHLLAPAKEENRDMECIDLPVADIQVGKRMRRLDSGTVEALCENIARIGLRSPISVTELHVLIAGLHRLEAVKKLGWATIPTLIFTGSTLEAEQAMIDENLLWVKPTVLEHSELLARREEILEAMGARNSQYIPPDGHLLQGRKYPDEVCIAPSTHPGFYYIATMFSEGEDQGAHVEGTKKPIRQDMLAYGLGNFGLLLSAEGWEWETCPCAPWEYNMWLYFSHEEYLQKEVLRRCPL